MRAPLGPFALLALATLLAVAPSGAATITVVNLDGAGEGFNDATAVAPVGGNPGTTRGAQRLNVFQHAADIWGGLLTSSVEIRVNAQFNSLACSANSGVLGSAGASSIHSNFSGAEYTNTWYSQALANKLAGADVNPGANDINATFNSDVDNSTCLGSTSWYYGFDGNEGLNVELLPVVLHELAHGLGFQTFANQTTFALAGGLPDIYTRFMYDNTTGKHWNQMSDAERQSSAVNTSHLVWDGPAATFKAPLVLNHMPRCVVNAPAGIAGDLAVGTANFGAALTQAGVTAAVVLADDGVAPTSDACSALVNGGAISGKIALIDRNACAFTAKAGFAQAAGATGVIIVNNVAGAAPQMGGTDPSITIPVVSVSQTDGNTLKANLGAGLNVTIGLHPTQLAGADATHRPMLYAPNPNQPGSSLSHFDVSAAPNLLMEPAINSDLSSSVDLTRDVFEDIGWFPHNTSVGTPPPVSVQLRGNAPNPFASATDIRFDVDRAGNAELTVFDVGGRLVKRLLDGYLAAGPHAFAWNGTDENGHALAPGVYTYRLRLDGYSGAKHMLLLR